MAAAREPRRGICSKMNFYDQPDNCTHSCVHTTVLNWAPHEREWNLARAYNLAAQFARGEYLLKVDSDTLLQPDVLARQPLGAAQFGRGCRDRARDENARHLNGVLHVRRAHFLAV